MNKMKKGRMLDNDVAMQLLAALLREAEDVAALRADLDGDRSDHIEQLIENLKEHIRLVEYGEAAPNLERFRAWLDSVSSIPAGAPSRWRRASKQPLARLRPLASTKPAGAVSGSLRASEKSRYKAG